MLAGVYHTWDDVVTPWIDQQHVDLYDELGLPQFHKETQDGMEELVWDMTLPSRPGQAEIYATLPLYGGMDCRLVFFADAMGILKAGQRVECRAHACMLLMNQRYSSAASRDSVRSSGRWLHRAARYGLILPTFLLLTACVSVRVEPLTHESYAPRVSGEPVQWLETEPDSPYVELARIIATSQSADEDRLRDNILTRASTMGADAVVLGKSDVLESMGQSHPYESTMGPGSSNVGLYGGGWWNYYDPWSFVQSSVDETEWTQYLSGTAIRYVNQK